MRKKKKRKQKKYLNFRGQTNLQVVGVQSHWAAYDAASYLYPSSIPSVITEGCEWYPSNDILHYSRPYKWGNRSVSATWWSPGRYDCGVTAVHTNTAASPRPDGERVGWGVSYRKLLMQGLVSVVGVGRQE